MDDYGKLHDAETDEIIRDATAEEAIASYDVTAAEGGVFPCDWRRVGGYNGEDSRLCYVVGADEALVAEYAAKHGIAFSAEETE